MYGSVKAEGFRGWVPELGVGVVGWTLREE
jgi:hypothetical protein